MKVFKFGGASVSTVDRIKNVAAILKKYQDEKLLIVVSALGKTTNELENVVEAFYNNDKEKALQLFDTIKQKHLQIQEELTTPINNPSTNKPINELINFFTEVEWLLHDKPVRHFDYYYDQMVSIGEMMSSYIVSHFLNQEGIKNQWVDVRDIFRTDNNFRNARIDWIVTADKINQQIQPLFQLSNMVMTQGFIGATDENESTTLGREGSDYSAAVFANLLNAESQTIWKDVQGVMNADPKIYKSAQWIQELNYKEVIEMAYYGAQVIHPKTIKPLQNKNIPLLVKSFINADAEGTVIHNKNVAKLPPIIVYKNKQVLVQLSSKDFSFVSEGLTIEMYRIFESLNFKPNLTQNAAISLLCVVDDDAEKVEQLALRASQLFDVLVTKELSLLTIRHYTDEIINELVTSTPLLTQKTPDTLQVLLNN